MSRPVWTLQDAKARCSAVVDAALAGATRDLRHFAPTGIAVVDPF